MKVQGFDGRIHTLRIKNRPNKKCSKYHLRARKLLKEIFPLYKIVEEITLPGSHNPPLYGDFFIPNQKILVEVHGAQHYEFNSHFHKDEVGFAHYKKLDRLKEEYCELNDFIFVELPYNETDDEWKDRILNGIATSGF